MNASAISQCGTHDKPVDAVVCCHHVQATNAVLGFVENSCEPGDLQAWCDDCERLFVSEGEMTEHFRRYNNFKVVCGMCYSDLRARHSHAKPD